MGYATTITGIYCDWRDCKAKLSLAAPSRSYHAALNTVETLAKSDGWSCWVGTPRSGLGRRREFCPQHGPADPSKARRIW